MISIQFMFKKLVLITSVKYVFSLNYLSNIRRQVDFEFPQEWRVLNCHPDHLNGANLEALDRDSV